MSNIFCRNKKMASATAKDLSKFFGIWKEDPIITLEEFESNRTELNNQLQKSRVPE
jgi:hypothetical protein